MTNHSVNDLASSFVEMAKAYERLPQVEADLVDTVSTIVSLQGTIQRLEEQLMDRANKISEMGVTIHNLEVAREDAELRFLEADDAKTTLVRVLEGLNQDIHGALVAVAPIPEPVLVEPQANVLEPPLPFDGPVDTLPSPDAAFSDDVQSGQSESPLPDGETTRNIFEPSTLSGNTEGSVQPDPTTSHSVTADGPSPIAPQPLPLASATQSEGVRVSSGPTTSTDTKATSVHSVDPQPTKYESIYGNQIIRTEWWVWRDRQIANGNPDPLDNIHNTKSI